VSTPNEIFLPIANWEVKENPVTEEDIGPLVQHVFELRNNGPSTFSKAIMILNWPFRYNNNTLLYIVTYDIDGPMECTNNLEINPLQFKLTDSQADEKNETRVNENRQRDRRDVTVAEGDIQAV
ncbi:integrin alpha-V, partial [Pelobates cultripes]